MTKDILEKVTANFLKKEKSLSPYATHSSEALRLKELEPDFRLDFSRDADKILHSTSFTRYINKTQVFSYNENDHITKRIIHVNLVSKIARTIGRALNLNEDLIEAIALGHDIGHTPLGHLGEKLLNEISSRELNEIFMHNIQSVRNYMFIENNGQGSNLTIQVLDGIMCHNGEILSNIYEPVKKTKEQFLEEYETSYHNSQVLNKLKPMTLEGCVVRISDIIAYIGRDIEDSIRLGIIKREDIPVDINKFLGNKNSDIITNIVTDLITNSLDKPYLMLSKELFEMLNKLKEFNYQHIYNHSSSEEKINFYREGINKLFYRYLDDIKMNNLDSKIIKYLNDMNHEYLDKTTDKRKVIDFIAGMTDEYFMKEVNKNI